MSQATINVPPASYLEDIGLAMGRIATGVYIVTAVDPSGAKVGMLASWVMQTGFEPPSVAVAVAPERELYKAIKASGRFTVNVLAEHAYTLMKAFSHYSPDQFDKVPYQDTGCGILLNDAVSAFHCRLIEEAGETLDHRVLLGVVEGGKVLNPNTHPYIHLRKTGFSY
ncbi:MAG: flavin reductase family protein [Vampirovibrionales bacterium]|nr:flavin reductase family protein [Vampirovibrionales bacterium]